MSTVSAKRQIILPMELCRKAGIKPGDEVETFIYNGQITIVKKTMGAAKGIIPRLRANK